MNITKLSGIAEQPPRADNEL